MLGSETFKHYLRAKEHIKMHGKLDERYAKKVFTAENYELYGYCQNQGLYLADKKYGQLKVFNDVKKKVSRNIIPNF